MIDEGLLASYRKLKSDRTVWEDHWEEIAERVLPRYAQSFVGVPQQGEKRTEKIFDGSAQIALETFAKIMEGMIVPRGQKWHKVRSSRRRGKLSANTLRYYDEVTETLFHYRYLPEANFQSQMFEFWLSIGAFGTGCLFLDRNDKGPGFRYRAISLAEIYIDENHQGVIDRVYRCFKLKLREMRSKFKKLPKEITDGPDDKEHEIIHCVYPDGNKFASKYILESNGMVIEEGSYSTMPYLISRYVTAPGETYGRSVAMMVLSNIKVLDEEKKTFLKQGHRIADPIILTHDDGVMDTFSLQPGSAVSGALTEDGKRLVDILPVGDLRVNDKMMEVERSIIKDAFMVNMFQILVETPRMTATEVLERTKEKAILMSPTMGRQQTELLGPMIEREIRILAEDGLLPEMPREVIAENGEYSVVYDSPLSRAARAEEATGFMQTLEMAMALAQARQDPSSLDWLNEDIAIPAIAEITSTPAAWIRSTEEVQALREKRQQMMQAQMALQAAPAAASIAKSVQ